MPQMMPINWLLSLFLFILIFILFNIINYFIFNYKFKNLSINSSSYIKNLTWKW